MSPSLKRHLPWLAGFLLAVNIYLIPPLAASPRALDLGGVVLAVWLMMALARGRVAMRPLALTLMAALPPLAPLSPLPFWRGLRFGSRRMKTECGSMRFSSDRYVSIRLSTRSTPCRSI